MIKKRFTKKFTPSLMVLPAIIILLIVMAYPLLYNLRLSFFNYNYVKHWQGIEFIGFGNYIKAVLDPEIRYSLRITLVFTIASQFMQLTLGLALALVMYIDTIPGKRILRASLLIPMMSSPIVI